jgi:hypothetical protein
MVMIKTKKAETTGACTQIVKMLFTGMMFLGALNYLVMGE